MNTQDAERLARFLSVGKGDDGHPAIEYTALSLMKERLKWTGIEDAVVRTHTFWNRGSGKEDRKTSFAGT